MSPDVRDICNPERAKFLQALNHFAPHIGEALLEIHDRHKLRFKLNDWMDKFRPLLRSRDGTVVSVSVSASEIYFEPPFRFLTHDLTQWAKVYNLYDPWLLEAAVVSMLTWRGSGYYSGLTSHDHLFHVLWAHSVRPFELPPAPDFSQDIEEAHAQVRAYCKQVTKAFRKYKACAEKRTDYNLRSQPRSADKVRWHEWLVAYQVWAFANDEIAYMLNATYCESAPVYEGQRVYKELSAYASSIGLGLRKGHKTGRKARDTFDFWEHSPHRDTFLRLYGAYKYGQCDALQFAWQETEDGYKVDAEAVWTLSGDESFWPRRN